MGIKIKSIQAYLIGLSLPIASEENFWKISWIEKQIHSMKYFKNRKMPKNTLLFSTATGITFLACKTLKFGFLFFCKRCIELNFLSKNNNLESIGILSRKLEPKYETGAEDNTSSTLSSTSFQNSERDQHQIYSSLFKQVYLSLSFRRKLIA